MKQIFALFLGIFSFFHLYTQFQKVHYDFSVGPIDVIMPVHPKDKRTLDLCIDGLRENVKNIRRIIVVSERKLTEKAEWFDESLFPFSKKTLALEVFDGDEIQAQAFINYPKSRIGWIFKQIVNLYSSLVVPDVSKNILVVDADTIFLKPVAFQDDFGNPLFNPSYENHKPYFDHLARLIPGCPKAFNKYSGISHHLLFNRDVIEDLFSLIIKHHYVEPWKAICRCIDKKELYGSCMADYEIYFNFLFLRSDQPKLRFLKWTNISFRDFSTYAKQGYDYLSCHTWIG